MHPQIWDNFYNKKPFQNDEKYFLFHLKTSFQSQLLNITRRNGNQTMKFDQLIVYNMIHIFLEKSYTKCGGETDPCLKIKIEQISGSTFWNAVQFVFIVCPRQSPPEYIKIQVLTTSFDLKWSFLKYKKRSGTSLPATFTVWILSKISLAILY